MGHDLEKRREFQMEEFRYVTDAIARMIDEQFKLERYALIGTFGTYAWIFSRPQSVGELAKLSDYALWIPPALIGFSILRSASLLFTLQGQIEYVKKLELLLAGEPGWQEFVVRRRKHNPGALLFRVSLTIFWFALLGAAIAIVWKFGT